MLYPKEDTERRELSFSCRTCAYSEEPSTACIYRNDLSNTVGETAGITQDVGQDPTVRVPAFPSRSSTNTTTSSSSMLDSNTPAASVVLVPQYVLQRPVLNEEEPCTCTVCGLEIVCETCGRPTAEGVCLVVDDDDEQETYVAGLATSLMSLTGLGAPHRTDSNESWVIEEGFEHDYMDISDTDPESEDGGVYYSEHGTLSSSMT
jgi:DNA-directed RNA polymerase II subunit RPB9